MNDGDEAAIEALLEAGARADAAVPGDGNALFAAAGAGDVDLLQRLIATGADVDSAAPGDGCPLIAAATARSISPLAFRGRREGARIYGEARAGGGRFPFVLSKLP